MHIPLKLARIGAVFVAHKTKKIQLAAVCMLR